MFITKSKAEELVAKIDAATLPSENEATVLGFRDILKNELELSPEYIRISKKALIITEAALKAAKPVIEPVIESAKKTKTQIKKPLVKKKVAKKAVEERTWAHEKMAENRLHIRRRRIGDPRNPRG